MPTSYFVPRLCSIWQNGDGYTIYAPAPHAEMCTRGCLRRQFSKVLIVFMSQLMDAFLWICIELFACTTGLFSHKTFPTFIQGHFTPVPLLLHICFLQCSWAWSHPFTYYLALNGNLVSFADAWTPAADLPVSFCCKATVVSELPRYAQVIPEDVWPSWGLFLTVWSDTYTPASC